MLMLTSFSVKLCDANNFLNANLDILALNWLNNALFKIIQA